MTRPPRTMLYIRIIPYWSKKNAVTYKPTAMITPATMNEEPTGAFWKKGATTDAVKIILPVSVRISAARFLCFSVSSTKKHLITFAAVCQFLSPHRIKVKYRSLALFTIFSLSLPDSIP